MQAGSFQVSDPALMSAVTLRSEFSRGQLSPVDALAAIEARIGRFEPAINAFAAMNERALDDAKASERRWVAGRPLGPIDGVPCTVKDIIDVAGLPTRHGSATSPTTPATTDALAVAALKAQGAVIIGKTTTTEFQWGASSRNPVTGITRNPWNLQLSAGGSSCGAAAAAAAGFGPLHVGADAGGSIRVPAAWCGVVGLKPTFGRVPLWPPGASFNTSCLGPVTRTVTDAALVLSVMAGYDATDPTSIPDSGRRWDEGIEAGVAGLRVAIMTRPGFEAPIDADGRAAVAAAAGYFEAAGAQIAEANPDLPDLRPFFGANWIMSLASLVADLPPAEREKVDADLLRLVARDRPLYAAEILAMEQQRLLVAHQMARFHRQYDIVVCPVVPGGPPAGDATFDDLEKTFWEIWAPWTPLFNASRQPAISVPLGQRADGSPQSVQLAAPQYREDLLFRAARFLERAVPAALPTLAASDVRGGAQ